MKRLATLVFLLLLPLHAQIPPPHQSTLNAGWYRHVFKLGPAILSLETPPELGAAQDGDPIPTEKLDLGGKSLRQPGEPITTGIAMFQASFDLEGFFLWEGVQSSLQVVLFLGQLEAGVTVRDFSTFHQQLGKEYLAFLETANAEAIKKGLAPRFKILEAFQPTTLGKLSTLRLRLLQEGQEEFTHFLPLGSANYLAITCRIQEGPKVNPKNREKGLAKARALAERILATLRQTPESTFQP